MSSSKHCLDILFDRTEQVQDLSFSSILGRISWYQVRVCPSFLSIHGIRHNESILRHCHQLCLQSITTWISGYNEVFADVKIQRKTIITHISLSRNVTEVDGQIIYVYVVHLESFARNIAPTRNRTFIVICSQNDNSVPLGNAYVLE